MWNAQLQKRWNDLSAKRVAEGLTDAEQQEWEQLTLLLDAEEMTALQPALQRYDARIAVLEQAVAAARQEKERLLNLLQTRTQERQTLEARLQQLEQEYQTLLAERQQYLTQTSKE